MWKGLPALRQLTVRSFQEAGRLSRCSGLNKLQTNSLCADSARVSSGTSASSSTGSDGVSALNILARRVYFGNYQSSAGEVFSERSKHFSRHVFASRAEPANFSSALGTLALQAGRRGKHVAPLVRRQLHEGEVSRLSLQVQRRQLSTAVLSSAPSSTLPAVHPLVHGGVKAQKAVGYWLFGCAGWVFSMVVLGGVTRLTRSGLSMTDWKFAGGLPPRTAQQWDEEFGKYKQSPEYKRVNLGMSLEEFKFIYWMEYAHRMWGRALGFFFAIPCTYFAVKGYITRPLAGRLAVLFAAGGAQGFVGWWMVKSGLEEPASKYEVPRVSPYRLAAHLTSAFAIYSGLLWTALSVHSLHPPTAPGSAAARRMLLPLAVLIGTTAVSGAFVAGLDAGHAYNTFPLMGGALVPEGVLSMQPVICNFFENTATVQFDHRLLATTTLLSTATVWNVARKLQLDGRTRLLLHGLLGMTCLQVTLGITTLLTYVPVSLGAAHQAGALTLFTIALALLHTLRRRPVPSYVVTPLHSQALAGKPSVHSL